MWGKICHFKRAAFLSGLFILEQDLIPPKSAGVAPSPYTVSTQVCQHPLPHWSGDWGQLKAATSHALLTSLLSTSSVLSSSPNTALCHTSLLSTHDSNSGNLMFFSVGKPHVSKAWSSDMCTESICSWHLMGMVGSGFSVTVSVTAPDFHSCRQPRSPDCQSSPASS